MKKIILVGYGGHARSVEDCILRGKQYEIVGYTDQRKAEQTDLSYLGTDAVLAEYYRSGVTDACIGIGIMDPKGKASDLRKDLMDSLRAIGFQLPLICDPSAILAEHVEIGEGTFIGKGAIVNAYTKIGAGSIINTGAILEHESRIGACSHISVGARLCGQVTVGEDCFVGAGSTVIQGITIGTGVTVGAGSVVIRDVEDGRKVVGNPAKEV